ncbi:hypothetical protein CJF31_00001490 [Rutstroemia sp. NJR-2017a BVV2]|nr:hypothetical protein CJF31_00001490 [Rutstroemia sp. NJR-2017a BVV2]
MCFAIAYCLQLQEFRIFLPIFVDCKNLKLLLHESTSSYWLNINIDNLKDAINESKPTTRTSFSMPPARKKRKVVPDKLKPTSPVVFQLATHPPDVKLKIFDDLEFHAHSTILKKQSAFFRAFMDSPDKRLPLTGEWKYEWVSVVDDDGTWSLVDIRHAPKDNNNPLEGDKSLQQTAFKKFIGVFYQQPWRIANTEELDLVIEMADYYCALPVVSGAFSAAFHRSKMFARKFRDADQRDLLSFAIKMRNADLFRDCMILICGDMGDSEKGKLAHFEPDLGDPALNSLATTLHNQIVDKIIKANKMLLIAHLNRSTRAEREELQNNLDEEVKKLCSEIDWSPCYYREMMIDRWQRKPGSEHSEYVGILDLLQNNITFNKGAYVNHNFRWYPDPFLSRHFLCADIKDSDLPVSFINIFLMVLKHLAKLQLLFEYAWLISGITVGHFQDRLVKARTKVSGY